MKNKIYALLLIALFPILSVKAQVAVSTDGSSADASAMLEVKSSDKGILIPRMTALERDNISNPATGLLVFVTDEVAFNYYDGSMWSALGGGNESIPVGTIEAFAGSTIPDGWLLCDGSAISRTTYSELFAVIDTKWGAGDGSTTFNLPDLRGRFMRGVDNGSGNDPDAAGRTAEYTGGNTGDNVGSYQSDATAKNGLTATASESGDHSHAISKTTGGGFYAVANGTGGSSPNPWSRTTPDGNHTHTITIGDGDEETRPLNAAVYYIIQY